MKTTPLTQLSGVVALVVITASLARGVFAAEVEDLSGDKPFIEIWDEEIATNRGIVTAIDGSVLLFTEEREPRGIIEVKHSDDGGKTWIPSEPFPLGGTSEPSLVELRDGRIYFNSRTHSRGGNKRIAHSDDGGQTWRDEHEDDELFDGPPDVYGCKAGLVRLPGDDRDVLVFSAPGSRESRTDITVWVSFDGGETWPVHRMVREGAGNYTWIGAGRKGTSSEGTIYLAAGKDWMARFNLAWILKGPENSQTPAESAARK